MRDFEVSVADAVQSDEDTGAIRVDLGQGPVSMSYEEARALAARLISAADTASLRVTQ
jgi:hypothetical protein